MQEIISTFQNFFYNKMILDITAIKKYQDLKTIQQLSISLDMDKLILLLDEENTNESMPNYLSKLISLGIYNFTTTIEGIMYLYNNPNTYRDVAQYHILDEPQQPIVQPTAAPVIHKTPQKRILGIKNITSNAGATTLTYMMKKNLEKMCNVVAIEIDKRDFFYFKDNGLISTVTSELGTVINSNSSKDVILIDCNASKAADPFCTDIIYLFEPSIIKLNKLISIKPTILETLKDKKIVLNRSCIDEKDARDFSYESGLDIFFNLPCLDDRKENEIINNLLKKLNIM